MTIPHFTQAEFQKCSKWVFFFLSFFFLFFFFHSRKTFFSFFFFFRICPILCKVSPLSKVLVAWISLRLWTLRSGRPQMCSHDWFWLNLESCQQVHTQTSCFNKPPSKPCVCVPSFKLYPCTSGSSAWSPAPLHPDISKFSLCNYVNVMFVFIGESHRLWASSHSSWKASWPKL